MSSTKQKEICFYFKHVKSCNSRNNNQNNNSKRTIVLLRRSGSRSITEIAMTYQPHQPPKTFKFPETVYGKQKHFRHWEYSLQRKRKKAFNFPPILNSKKGLIS